MKAIVVHEFGAPEVMKLEESPTPKAGAGQAVVRIHAAGVNPFDTYMRAGTYAIKPPLPYVPGGEGAGVVHAVGEDQVAIETGRQALVVSDDDEARAKFAIQLQHQFEHLCGIRAVEIPGRFVCQEKQGLIHQSARDGRSLHFPAGKLGGTMVAAVI